MSASLTTKEPVSLGSVNVDGDSLNKPNYLEDTTASKYQADKQFAPDKMKLWDGMGK
jgi:hypothetical protein